MQSNAAVMIDSSEAHEQTPSGRMVTTDGRELPLRSASVEAEAAGGIARVVLTQRFDNPFDEPLQVRYLLPLPSDGAVSGFAFHVGDQRVVGEIDRRKQAQERFEQAIAEGRTAALLDQERSSLFTQQVGNIPPRTEVIAEVTVDQRLRWLDEGAWEWRFPTTVGPRYLGAAGRVADARAQAVDVAAGGIDTRLTLALTIEDALSARSAVESASHPIDVEVRRDAPTQVRFAGDAGTQLDRDVVVRWQVVRPEVGLSLSLTRPSDSAFAGAAYGLLTVTPPDPKAKLAAQHRDLIFLIDTSGSMGGRPLQQAARVAAAMIDTLGPRDRIELIEFGDRPVRWRSEPVAATRDGKKAATKWVRSLRASGATEMRDAIFEALEPLRSGTQRQVVLITDGYIGFESEIVSTITERLPRGARLHTVGVGSSVNRSLTGPAARAGRGVELIIGIDEDAERVAERLLRRTTAPIVTSLRIGGQGVRATTPAQLPDLFAGSPVLISLELDPAGGTIEVSGDGADGDYSQQVTFGSATLGEGNQAVTALFGRERVEDLETQLAAGAPSEEMNATIEKVGLTFQIATRLTSWIAVTDEAMVDPKAPRKQMRMPHELPFGTSIEGFGLRSVDDGGTLAMASDVWQEPSEPVGEEYVSAYTTLKGPAPLAPQQAPLSVESRQSLLRPKRSTRFLRLLLVLLILVGLAALIFWLVGCTEASAGVEASVEVTPSAAARALRTGAMLT